MTPVLFPQGVIDRQRVVKPEGRVRIAYADWSALPLERKNALCAEAMGWFMLDGLCMRLARDWSPCTDRNHTAMMVEEVGLRGLQTAFLDATGIATMAPRRAAWDLLASDADLLAWAACEALRQSVAANGAGDATSGQRLPKEA